MLRRIENEPGFAPASVGAALILQLCLVGVFCKADTERVYVAGRGLNWTCSFKERYGVPCPGCGMTRSIVLSCSGKLGLASQLNPAGPAVVVGVIVLACVMIALGIIKKFSHRPGTQRQNPWSGVSNQKVG